MAWRWTARRLVISAFVVFHLSGLILWTNPPCAIKDRLVAPFRYYILPLGLWQWWAVFAPDPIRNTMVLDAEVIDAKGMRHIYEFPRIGELPWWQRMPRYRNPKFAANMQNEEYAKHREFTARYAVRQLGLGDEAFPVAVSLYYEVKDSPPPGVAERDLLAQARVQVIEYFQFASMKEVRP